MSLSHFTFSLIYLRCAVCKSWNYRGAALIRQKSTYEFKCTAPPFWLLWCLCLNDWAFTPELKLHLTYPLQAAHFTTSAASSHPGYKQNPFIFPVIYNPRMNKIPHAESFNFACVITRHCKLQPVPALLLQSTHRVTCQSVNSGFMCVWHLLQLSDRTSLLSTGTCQVRSRTGADWVHTSYVSEQRTWHAGKGTNCTICALKYSASLFMCIITFPP